MALNWNPEVISDFIFVMALLFSVIITLIKPNTKNIRSLFYIRLALCFGSIMMLLDGIALLFISEPISIISGFMLVPLALSMIIGVNYIIKDHFYSFGFLLAFGLSILFIYLGFQPGAIETRIQGGYVRLPWIGLFSYLGILIYALILGYLFYWGVKTVKNAPFLIRKEAILFFIGLTIYSLLTYLFYLLYKYTR